MSSLFCSVTRRGEIALHMPRWRRGWHQARRCYRGAVGIASVGGEVGDRERNLYHIRRRRMSTEKALRLQGVHVQRRRSY